MKLKQVLIFFNNPQLIDTKLSPDYLNKRYSESVKIVVSKRKSLLLFFFMLFIAIICLTAVKENNLGSYIFLTVIVAFSVYKLVDTRPKIVLSKEGIRFKRAFVQWSLITHTKIAKLDDPSADTYELWVYFGKNSKKKILLTDLNYEWEEISHMVEFFKQRGG